MDAHEACAIESFFHVLQPNPYPMAASAYPQDRVVVIGIDAFDGRPVEPDDPNRVPPLQSN
jgi:hypothetical protein